MPTLNGACPGCGQPLTLEVAVRTAPRGFTSDSRQVQLVGDREPGQGGTPTPDNEEPYGTTRAAAPHYSGVSRPHPSPVNSQDGRPTCPECGLDGARLEQVAKKSGRAFTAWKCINTECDQNDEIIPGTFRWGKAAA